MKKLCILLLALFTCSLSYADRPEFSDILSSKVIDKGGDREGYFSFLNGTCWQVVGFSPRWRTLSEWWNGVELAPDNYTGRLEDWQTGTQIDIYPLYGGSAEVNLNNASNQEILVQCTYLFVNTRTRQILFATPMHPGECMTNVAEKFYKSGKQDGYAKGLSEGRNQKARSYEQGHADGYEVGYAAGLAAGRR